MAKEIKLRIFKMEIISKAIGSPILFEEIIHFIDTSLTTHELEVLKTKLKYQTVMLLHHKRKYSFLKTLERETWNIVLFLSDTKIFQNETELQDYIRKNKIKNGPLFGMSYNNFFF